MQIKHLINKWERILSEKYPHIDVEFYCSRRKKIVHFGLEKAIQQYQDYLKFINDIELFFLRNMKNSSFEFVKPQLVNSVKWKFDYVVFRRQTSNSSKSKIPNTLPALLIRGQKIVQILKK